MYRNIKLVKAEGQSLEKVKEMYLEYFPIDEQKPFEFMVNNANMEVLALINEGVALGLVITMKAAEYVLLDYLAIDKHHRSGGIGGKVLNLLRERYKDYKGIYLEIERLGYGKTKKENETRERRKSFYDKNGCVDGGFNTLLMGVDMQVMFIELSGKCGGFEGLEACYLSAIGRDFIDSNLFKK